MKQWFFGAVLAALPVMAHADVVLNTSLPALNGAFGAGTAVTVTSPAGTTTAVTGPGGSANRASAAPAADAWVQRNVGGGATVGITTTYADNNGGNGSAYFKGTSGDSKGDLELFLSQSQKVSSLSELTYEWYRDAASSVAGHLHPTLRLIVGNSASAGSATVGGYLVYEAIYQDPPVNTAATDTWVFENVFIGNLWATGNLPGNFNSAAPAYDRDLTEWDGLVDDLHVYGISIGFGSGWNGAFEGAIDNVTIAFGDRFQGTWDFEVAVPEPSAIAILGAGLLAFGVTRARRRLG